jgi:hypothetical protein
MMQELSASPHVQTEHVHLKLSTPGDIERKKQIGDNAVDALRRLMTNQTFEDWRQVGVQMMIVAEETMADLKREKWDGDDKLLVREFVRRFDTWQGKVTNAKPISKQERWALREVMTDPKYQVWYMDLPGPKQRKMNHPNAIINAYKRVYPDPAKVKEKMHRLPPAIVLESKDREIEELKARTNELSEELSAARAARPRVEPDTLVGLLSTLVRHMKDGDLYSKRGIAGLEEAGPDFDTIDLSDLGKALGDLGRIWKSYRKERAVRMKKGKSA